MAEICKKSLALLCTLLGLMLFGGLTAKAELPTSISFANVNLNVPAAASTVLYYKPDPLDNSRYVAGNANDYTISYYNDNVRQRGVLTMKNAALTIAVSSITTHKTAFYVNGGILLLRLIGTNTIGHPTNLDAVGTESSYGMRAVDCYLTMLGDSPADSLTVTAGKSANSFGIVLDSSSLTIDHCTVHANGGEVLNVTSFGGQSCGIDTSNMGYPIRVQNGAVVTAKGGTGGTDGDACARSHGISSASDVIITSGSYVSATGDTANLNLPINSSTGVDGSGGSLTVNGASTLIATGGWAVTYSKGISIPSATVTDASVVVASSWGTTGTTGQGFSVGCYTPNGITLSDSTLEARSGPGATSNAIRVDHMSAPVLTYAKGYQWRTADNGKWVDSSTSDTPSGGWLAQTYLGIRPNQSPAPFTPAPPTVAPSPTPIPNPPPQTGDSAAPLLWLGLLLTAGVGLLMMRRIRRT